MFICGVIALHTQTASRRRPMLRHRVVTGAHQTARMELAQPLSHTHRVEVPTPHAHRGRGWIIVSWYSSLNWNGPSTVPAS